MGLDIAAGAIVLLGAIRGWFRGFILQAIRLGGLVGSLFLAAPVRDLARPYVAPYLATIRPDLLDRMLWWAAAVVCYLVTVGFANMLVHLQRRRPYAEPEVSRLDQSAGFCFAATKAAVVVAFLLANLDKHAMDWAQSIPWVGEQIKDSRVLSWHRDYRPADRIWAAPPVQQLVAHVRKMGLSSTAELSGSASDLITKQLLPTTASTDRPNGGSRTPRLGLPSTGNLLLPPADAADADVALKIDQAAQTINHP